MGRFGVVVCRRSAARERIVGIRCALCPCGDFCLWFGHRTQQKMTLGNSPR